LTAPEKVIGRAAKLKYPVDLDIQTFGTLTNIRGAKLFLTLMLSP